MTQTRKLRLLDCVYPLGSGSRWEDDELRFSLRSLSLANVRDVYVIGRKPDWYTGKFIEYKENGRRTENVFNKTKIACQNEDISDNFIFMNDDIFLLNKLKIANTYCKTVKHKWGKIKPNQKYCDYIKTHLHFLNFAVHTPFFINKTEWLEVMDGVKIVPGFSPRDYYGNHSELWDRKSIKKDVKFRGRTLLELKDFVKGLPFFSAHSGMSKSVFKPFFDKLYPNPSKWEE